MPTKLFAPGNTYSVGKGRPKGARNRLTLQFLEDVLSIWTDPAAAAAREGLTKGAEALLVLYREKPAEFIRQCFSLASKDVQIESGPITELDDDELARMIEHMHRRASELETSEAVN
jgi:hypothetical protein